MLEHLPEVIVVGNVEMLLAGIAFGAGFPKLGMRIVHTARGRRVPDEDSKSE